MRPALAAEQAKQVGRRINQAGLELIKSFESLRLVAYLDSAGIPTIGWGATKGVRLGDVITEAEAIAELEADLAEASAGVERLVKVDLTDNQFAALVSFVFNLGAGALDGSSLLRKLNAVDFAGAADEFLRWDKAHVKGVLKVLPGLTRRRQAERELFLAQDDTERS